MARDRCGRNRPSGKRTNHKCEKPPNPRQNMGRLKGTEYSKIVRQGAPFPMDISLFTFIVFAGSLVAGFLGALTGLGGGVVVVPLLTLVLGVDIRYAVGASLVSVIATSSGAAAAYVREGFSSIRIGMFLEIATTLGALVGAYLATRLPTGAIGVIFGAVLLFSAYFSSREHPQNTGEEMAGSSGAPAQARRPLSRRARRTGISGAPGSTWFRCDVRRGHAFWLVGNRFGSDEGSGDGPGHAASL